jgi:hypothetical protein
MQYWIVAFTAALVVVIGYAAGPVGAVISLLAFSTALYLIWARKLGFNGAWTRFGVDRLTAPLWKSANWDQLGAIFNDRESVLKAATIALALIALSLILPVSQVALIAIAIGAWYAFDVYRTHKPVAKPSVTAALESKVANDKVLYTPAASRSDSAKQ